MNRNIGQTIVICTSLIIGMGLLSLYSATYQNSRVSDRVFYDQMLGAGVGLFVMLLLGRVDHRKFYDAAYVLYGISVIFLILVIFAGRHALGAQRWFEIAGISFQPSELMKLTLILALSRYFTDHKASLSFRSSATPQLVLESFIIPLMLTMFPALLIFKQPDLGTAILVFGIFYIMIFVSGLNYKALGGFTFLCLAALPFAWHILKPYQRDRLLVFMNPNIDPLGAGYTIIQSKIAIGSGQLFGKGWLSGTQNQLNFLPERHTDFIFSVVGEEWGLVGTLFVLSCYFVVISCGLKIAEQVKDDFAHLMTMGIVGILSLQVVINIGMVMGLFPVVGITLPLVSYGRTSFFVFIIMLGFLFNLSSKRSAF